MRRVLAGVSGASAATLLLALVLWFSLCLRAEAFSPFDLFQQQESGAQSQQSNQRSERSDAALFELFHPHQSAAQGLDVSAYANDMDALRVYRHHRYWRHARHHRSREHTEEGSASNSNAPAGGSLSEPSAEVKPTWDIATAPTAMQPERSAVSTFQVVIITQDGGDPFERCMTAYYWSRLNHALQADQFFHPAPRYAVDAISPTVTGDLTASWIDKSVGR